MSSLQAATPATVIRPSSDPKPFLPHAVRPTRVARAKRLNTDPRNQPFADSTSPHARDHPEKRLFASMLDRRGAARLGLLVDRRELGKDLAKNPSRNGFDELKCRSRGIPEFRTLGKSESKIPSGEGISAMSEPDAKHEPPPLLSARARIRPKAQLTLPEEIRRAMHVGEGDEIEFTVHEDGTITARGLRLSRVTRRGSSLRRGWRVSSRLTKRSLRVEARCTSLPRPCLPTLER